MLSATAQPQPYVICHPRSGTGFCLQITGMHASNEWNLLPLFSEKFSWIFVSFEGPKSTPNVTSPWLLNLLSNIEVTKSGSDTILLYTYINRSHWWHPQRSRRFYVMWQDVLGHARSAKKNCHFVRFFHPFFHTFWTHKGSTLIENSACTYLSWVERCGAPIALNLLEFSCSRDFPHDFPIWYPVQSTENPQI
jgi:hypothetical protein